MPPFIERFLLPPFRWGCSAARGQQSYALGLEAAGRWLPDPSRCGVVPGSSAPQAQSRWGGARGKNRTWVSREVTPEKLVAFFHDKTHTHLQASQAAKAYIGKWMKYSGPIHED